MRQCYSGPLTNIIMQCVISNIETKRITMEKPQVTNKTVKKLNKHTPKQRYLVHF